MGTCENGDEVSYYKKHNVPEMEEWRDCAKYLGMMGWGWCINSWSVTRKFKFGNEEVSLGSVVMIFCLPVHSVD